MRHLFSLSLVSLIVLSLALTGTAAATAPAAAESPQSPLVDHSAYDGLLQRYVHDGTVDYKGLATEVAVLDAYIKSLADVSLAGLTREQALAFYINAYNACTLRLILRHYETIKSIRDLHRPWKQREWLLAGQIMSLDEIEHGKLRGELAEPLIHFAIVCASIGCPDLANHAYTEAAVNEQLDRAARQFMGSPKHLHIAADQDGHGGRIYLSQIFNWFRGDFTDGRGDKGLIDFLLRYVDDKTAAFLREHGEEVDIRYLEYDWNLNG